MQRSTAKLRYQQHVANAKKRGIEFQMSFEEWVGWWLAQLGPCWLSRRGTERGRYVMARNGDTGPYALWNVKCVLASENVTEQVVNGTSAPGERSKINRISAKDAIAIFESDATYEELQAEFGVSISAINDIKSRRTWRRETDGKTRNSTRGRNQYSRD